MFADGKACHIATDRFYTTVENCWEVKKAMGHLLYGTIRADRGPQYSSIRTPEDLPNDGNCLCTYVHHPMPLTIYHWRDSLVKGSWFVSTCHNAMMTEVL